MSSKLKINWNLYDTNFQYAAMDDNGVVCLYEVHPILHDVEDGGWTQQDGTKYIYNVDAGSMNPKDWKESVTRRPTELVTIRNLSNSGKFRLVDSRDRKKVLKKLEQYATEFESVNPESDVVTSERRLINLIQKVEVQLKAPCFSREDRLFRKMNMNNLISNALKVINQSF